MSIKPEHPGNVVRGALMLAFLVLAASAAAAQTPTPSPAADSSKAPAPRAARPAPSAASDSLVQKLRAMKGFTVVEYEGESATFRADEGVLRLQGNASVTREGEKLTADTIIYLRDRKLVEAFGHPTVSGQAQEIEGNVLVYDFERKRATVRGGRTKYEQMGATWLVQGDVTAEGGGANARFYTTSGCFTTDERYGSCVLAGDSMPQYHFESDRIMVIRDKIIVARPARLYFRNVPVFWLPFVVQNLEKGRRSGLLVPQFGLNDIVQTSSKQSREISNVGFYWAINDYLGGQLSGRWRSGSYTSLTGALDYRVRRQFFEGNFIGEQFWPQDGGKQLTFSSSNSWKPDERTTLGLSARYASSTSFVRRTTTEYGEAIQDLTSNFRADRRFDWGTVALSADRRQSMNDGTVDMTLPSLSISPNSITLFPALDATSARWYNNANLKTAFSGSRQTFARPLDLQAAQQKRGNESRLNLSGNQNFQMGNFTWSADARLNRTLMEAIAAIDSVPPTDRRNNDNAQWNTSLAYRLPLMGSSSLSPNLSLSQALVRNERSARFTTPDRYVAGPVRANFGAGTSLDLYGFFPGIGAYSAIRHRLSLSPSYRYSPRVVQTAEQDSVFGKSNAMQQNVVSLSFNQTFEAKLKASKPKDSDRVAQDSLSADSVGFTPEPPAGPEEVRKVTVLRIDTSPLEFDFERAKQGKSGFRTHQLTNTIGSDYMRGLSINFSHELFKPFIQGEGEPYDPDALGAFSPHLSQVNAQFEIGPGSGILRWLGLGEGHSRDIGNANRGQVPGVAPDSDPMLGGPSTATGVRRPTGDGHQWNLSVQYALIRPREALSGPNSGESQNVNGTLAFPLTPNWAFNWRTNYSITDGKFGAHQLTLVRDLYRWQANFNFVRTETGNTSFQFSVHLKDLPDLKVDYRDRTLGGFGQ
jgi:hypothetical protein